MNDRKPISRRDLLREAAGAAALTGLGACFPDVGGQWATVQAMCVDETNAEAGAGEGSASEAGADGGDAASRVVDVHDPASVIDVVKGTATIKQVQGERVKRMLDSALRELAGGAANPWSVLLPEYETGMRIGIKANCLNETVPTSPHLIAALVASLKQHLSIDAQNIIVWDRRLDELERNVGYTSAAFGGAQVVGTVNSTTDPSGPGYTGTVCGMVEGKTPRLSRILTERTDVTINCPVLKTHAASGITGAMKNIYGIIDIPGMYHDNIKTALPALYKLPPIRKSLRVTIVDALQAVIFGGTDSLSDAEPGRILAALDPVAIDSYALELINQLRRAKKPTARIIGSVDGADVPVTAWLDNAEKLGLGTRKYSLQAIEIA